MTARDRPHPYPIADGPGYAEAFFLHIAGLDPCAENDRSPPRTTWLVGFGLLWTFARQPLLPRNASEPAFGGDVQHCPAGEGPTAASSAGQLIASKPAGVS